MSKKDIFALLSRPVPFDDGYKVGHYRSLFFFRPVPFDYCFKYLTISFLHDFPFLFGLAALLSLDEQVKIIDG